MLEVRIRHPKEPHTLAMNFLHVTRIHQRGTEHHYLLVMRCHAENPLDVAAHRLAAVRFANIANQVRTRTGPNVQVQVHTYGRT
jgi:hypothetical protein